MADKDEIAFQLRALRESMEKHTEALNENTEALGSLEDALKQTVNIMASAAKRAGEIPTNVARSLIQDGIDAITGGGRKRR